MKVKIFRNRQVVLETNDTGTQYENLAETLKFEFPEYVEKEGQDIATSTLNKYIVFDIEDEENTDLIVNDEYAIPYAITKLGKVVAFLELKEHTDNDDMTDKLIWISDGFLLTFDVGIETNIEITQEKIDAFNTLYTQLNLKILEVTQLQLWIEQFKQDVEAGKYDGKDGKDGKDGEDGYTPVKGVDYFTEAEINQIKQEVLTSLLHSTEFITLENNVNNIKEELENNVFLIARKKEEE